MPRRNQVAGATTNFLHTDWLGTRRVMTSVSGANSETCTGLPFGDSLSCTGTNWDFNHFTDDIHDSESNTEHTWFRQLSSTQGRWMRPDPYLGSIDLANPQSLNRYAYVLNNPINLFDPFGLDYCKWDDGTKDDAPADGGDTFQQCQDGGGTWVVDTSVTVTAGPGDPCEDGLPGACGEGPDRSPTGSNNNPGNPGAGAANNRTPWYKSCTAQALLKGAGTTALDAVGILPEGGTVSAAFSLFHGAAGVSNGINIQQRVAFAAGIVSTAAAANDLQGPQESTLSATVTGLQAAAGGFGIAKGLIEDIPIAGQAIAIGATALDLVGTGLEVAKCYR